MAIPSYLVPGVEEIEKGSNYRVWNSLQSSERRASGHLVVTQCHCTTVSAVLGWAGDLTGKNVWANTMEKFGTSVCHLSQ